MSVKKRTAALADHRFRRLWLGYTTSSIGDALVPIALAFAVFQIGGRAAALGLVLAAYSVGQVAFILVGGVWADRLPRRLVMLSCDAIRALIDAFIAAALLTGRMEVWMFVVAGTLFGAASGFFLPASTGLVPQTVSRAMLQEANALLSLSRSLVRIGGPALSGLIITVAAPGWVFAIDALSFVGSAAFLAALRVTATEPRSHGRFLSELAEGARDAWSRGWLRAGFLLSGVINLGLGVFFVLGPVVSERDLGGAAAWGVILTSGSIGGAIGGVLALRVRLARPLVGAFVAWSLPSLLLLALVPPLPTVGVAVANVLFLLGVAFGDAMFITTMQREISPQRLSRVDSFDWLVSRAFVPLGQVAAGPAANAVGIDVVLVGSAVLVVASCVVGVATRSVREMHGPTSRPEPVSSSGT